jgi:flagellar biosynthesis/type III secretory pathway chaperone
MMQLFIDEIEESLESLRSRLARELHEIALSDLNRAIETEKAEVIAALERLKQRIEVRLKELKPVPPVGG